MSSRQQRVAELREAARIEQDNLCFLCGNEMTRAGTGLDTSCTAEHLVPRCYGGRDVKENIVAACKRCNEAKDDAAAFMPKPTGRKHKRNSRVTPEAIQAQERKAQGRMQMWRQSCPVK
jgi:5-methylcytosine-specific restriction endonuclease McrA